MYFIKFVGTMKGDKGDLTHTVQAKEHITRHYKDGTKRVEVINDKGGETHYHLSKAEEEYTTAFVMNDKGDTIERISIHRMTADTLHSKSDKAA